MFGRVPEAGAGRARAQAQQVLRDMAVKSRERNAREARSAGFPVDGARYVLYDMSLSGTTCVAVRDQQVEHYAKDSGSIFDSDYERTVVPWAAVSDVSVEGHGAESVLTITGPNGAVSIKTRPHEVEYAVGLIEELRAAATDVPATTGPAGNAADGKLPPVEALAQLTAMHEAGLVTDAEFAAKRAEILDRL
jgi:hypothetical protein